MSEKNSLAKKRYWEGIDKDKRSEMARFAATEKWKKVSVEDRKKHAMLMVMGRKKSTFMV